MSGALRSAVLEAAAGQHHQAPAGVLAVVVVVLGTLYLAWRRARLSANRQMSRPAKRRAQADARLSTAGEVTDAERERSEQPTEGQEADGASPARLRSRAGTLVPLGALIVVVVVILITRG